MRLQLRQAGTLILLSGLTFTYTANANHDPIPKKTLLVVNSLEGKKIFLSDDAKNGLEWIAKHAFKPTTTAGLFYKGKVYRKKTQILAIARKIHKHRWPLYIYRGKVAPEAFSAAVTKYFGHYAPQAVRVSFCESGWRTWASNGQYKGTFQMGSYARSRYGHGSTYDAQAKAASRYFFASGADWSPWQCKPY